MVSGSNIRILWLLQAFNNAASRGGPIREGLPVRISHIGNTILKLEVPASANK